MSDCQPCDSDRRDPKRIDLEKLAWNPPPPGFNPLTANNETLNFYHLPLRPNQDLTPISYANWIEVMSPPIDFIREERAKVFVPQNEFRLRPLTRASSQLEFSQN